MPYSSVIQFWFEEIEPKQWWCKDTSFDRQIAERFGEIHAQAATEGLIDWREADEGRLAEIIVLDQFSRNMFRGTPDSFAQDILALKCCKQATEAGAHTRLDQAQANFILMPIMHSESLHEHQNGLALFETYASKAQLRYEVCHREIIEQFGRYPHRNAILGRTNTPEEITFLAQPGSSF